MSLRTSILRAAAPALALLLTACWVPLERGRQMEARLDRLEADSAEQQRVVADRVAAVDRKIVEVQQKIDELNRAARRSGADLGVSLQRLQDEFTRVKGDLEVEQHRLGQIEKSVGALSDRTDKRFAALRGRGALDELEAKERIDTLERPDDKVSFLALAQKEEATGDKSVARTLYDEYVRRWPADAMAPEAAFHSAERSMEQKRWREALVAYGWIYEKAPRSERAPDAMLGIARAMLEVDELKKDAPGVLKELVAKFPRSDAAAQARKLQADLTPKKPRRK
ncbi:conserved hypothetical protein [Anaeromyxobacter dehalogenans 2CP-1]|uniref:Cell division coordinator CpoB n=1 Tax=Anaeromyxobacter dehalogenans (strain ATCC BAA-258 / DSM 21875 / 2CP-1) TaxID=455488 RepID=B8J5E9_ANAD2|nr:hypothetical protein [Anaeromyxobacter dehalogenans]ACL66811.1 conserved hypothetical protein [Anaeromyxobacter dehalogenans 2CP-1]